MAATSAYPQLALETLIKQIEAALMDAGNIYGGQLILDAVALTCAGTIVASGAPMESMLDAIRIAVERLSQLKD